jgi:hypothetical protein
LVINGSIVFWVTDPSGVIVSNDSNITNTTFSFAAEENGTYTMHLRNPYLTQNVTVALNYNVNWEFIFADVSRAASNIAIVKVFQPLQSPLPDHPDPDLETYLIFPETSEISEMIQKGLVYMPIQEMFAAIGCIIVVVGLGIVEQHRVFLKKRAPIFLGIGFEAN